MDNMYASVPTNRREFFQGLCGGALTLAVVSGLAGCGGGNGSPQNPNNQNNTPDLPITKDIRGVTVAGKAVTGTFVNDTIPVGLGKALTPSTTTVQGTKGSKVTVGIDAPGNVDAFYIAVGGRTGYYKVDLTGSKQARQEHNTRDVSVHYNLEVDIPTDASDTLSVGIVSLIGSVLSLMFGITICFGPCTPPPPPPDVTGRWTVTLAGLGVGAFPAIPFRFASFKQQPDATAIFNVIDESGGGNGVAVGAGRIASNGNCTIYFSNPLSEDSCAGTATSGVYIKNGADNGGHPEIKGGLGAANLCANFAGGATPADFSTPIDGAISIWKKVV